MGQTAINMFDYGCRPEHGAFTPSWKSVEMLFNLNVFSCSETKRRARQCNASRESQRGIRDSNVDRGVSCAFPSAPFVFLLWQSEKGQNASDLPAETVSFWPDPAEHMAQA